MLLIRRYHSLNLSLVFYLHITDSFLFYVQSFCFFSSINFSVYVLATTYRYEVINAHFCRRQWCSPSCQVYYNNYNERESAPFIFRKKTRLIFYCVFWIGLHMRFYCSQTSIVFQFYLDAMMIGLYILWITSMKLANRLFKWDEFDHFLKEDRCRHV